MSIIQAGVGGPLAIAGASGGYITAWNIITTSPQQVAGLNPRRQRIIFHNPGVVNIFIAPVNQIINGSQQSLNPTTVALGGCFLVYANGGTLSIEGECQWAWQAFAASGSANPLTVMQSNI